MDNFNEKILNRVKNKIAISKFEGEDKLKEKNIKSKVSHSIVAASVIFTLSAGLVFAKDIENFIAEKFNLRNMHQEAVDNGYIGTTEMDYIETNTELSIGNSDEIVDNIITNLKISDFMMTDDFFDFEMEINFEEKINQYKDLNRRVECGNIDYENFGSIELKDFFILDEENRLIGAPSFLDANEESFNKFCKEHDLPYKYREYNENYYENGAVGVQSSPENIVPESNSLQNLVFRIFAYDKELPKSKHLTVYFSKIAFIPKLWKDDGSDIIYLHGDWKIELDIPEIMQNREDVTFKVVSCDNKDFEVIEAVADETGFSFLTAIKNLKRMDFPKELVEKEDELLKENNYSINIPNNREGIVQLYGSEELADLYEDYHRNTQIINLTGEKRFYWEEESEGCYVLNSKGEKIADAYRSIGPGFEYEIVYDENGFSSLVYSDIYKSGALFSITKFDIPDKITVVIDFKGSPVKIELERIK